MKKRVIAAIAVLLVICIIGAGGYAGNMFGYFNRGNSAQYSVKNCEALDSSLKGKTVIFLGSSVTYGFASKGESFVDYLVAQDGLVAVKEAKKEMGGLTDNVQGAISVFGQLGGAMQQLEDPGAKVAGLIMSAIAEVAATFASSLKGTFTPWDWIAAAISGTSTMIATIAAIKSATSGGSYATGGIVGGNSPSGDNVISFLNSGEGVLTKQGIANAGALMENDGLANNLHLSTDVSGTNLRIVLDNDNRSKGGSRGAYSRIK
jgi:hypothetical protein